MPPSQLKRLKASLREQGIVGPQQSKKQKKQNAQNGGNKDKRVNRTVALTGIREQFNPFEVKTSARGPKFEVTNNRTLGGRVTKSVKGRPGVTKGLGEETVSKHSSSVLLRTAC
jgi:nucleolar protein 14